MTGAANAMIGGYATYQLARVAQMLGATTGQYAVCTPFARQAVYENWHKTSPSFWRPSCFSPRGYILSRFGLLSIS
jgi:hypothetical protein